MVSKNVFAHSNNWDYQKELEQRDPNGPYILHQDEFLGNEEDYTQVTLTYFQGDDILVDEQQVPVHNHFKVVGPLRFGHGSKQENVVYVRNEELRHEYEILRDSSSYAVEVLGIAAENEIDLDASRQSLRRFREE